MSPTPLNAVLVGYNEQLGTHTITYVVIMLVTYVRTYVRTLFLVHTDHP